jgi:hypothetical protein
MRILIAGGAGCLGSNLTEHWYPRGHEIMILDNFSTGRRELVPQLPRLELVEGTIANRDLVHRAFEIFVHTHVVHAAAAYKDPTAGVDVETNVLGTINLIEAARIGRHACQFADRAVLRPRYAKPIPLDYRSRRSELRHFKVGGASPCDQRPRLVCFGSPMSPARASLSAHSDALQASQGPAAVLLYGRYRTFLTCQFISAVNWRWRRPMSLERSCGNWPGPLNQGNLRSGPSTWASPRPGQDRPDQRRRARGRTGHTGAVEKLGWAPKVDFRTTMQRVLEWYDAHGVNEVHSHLVHDGGDRQRQVSHAAR